MSKLCIVQNVITNNKFSMHFLINFERKLSRNIVRYSSKDKNPIKFEEIHKNLNSQNYLKLTGTFVNENNIYQSFIPDIDIKKIYLHEYVWENIDKWSDKTALVCAITGRSYKYGQLRRLCGRLATSLRKNNLRPGDTIAIITPNVPEYAIVLMGASEAGLKVTLLNPNSTHEEMKKQLVNSETVAVITVPDKYLTVAKSISDNTTIRLPIIVIDDGYTSMPLSGIINFKDFLSDDIEEYEKIGKKTERNIEHDTVFLPYSSGTTGLPKGVELTHSNMIANVLQISHEDLSNSEAAFGDYQEIIPLFLPLYHIYGLVVCLSQYLGRGAKLICMPQFTSNSLLEVLEKNRATLLYAAPPVYNLIANDDRFDKRHFESLKMTMSGAAPISIEILGKFFARIKTDIIFAQGYGLTETSPVMSRSKGAPFDSVGYIVPNSNIRIVGRDESNLGKNLGINEVGEIWVRGPHVMKGYYKNPNATADSFDNEWFKTGDLGLFDNDGYFYIKGRLKELIKVQGYQVSPAEIEDIIQGHENVVDAAVIGIPDERFGEIPKAFVVVKSNTNIDEQEIKDLVAKQVSKYKQLGQVVFVDKIPKSAAGKILRNELKKM